MTVQQQYAAKRREAGEAIRLVQDYDTVVVPTGAGEPPTLLETLSAHRTSYHGVTISQILPLRTFDYLDPATVEHIRHRAYFLGGATRPGAQAGWIDYYPNYFGEVPAMFRGGLLHGDVVMAMASPMDKHGFFSLGLAPDYTMAALEQARSVILEVNPAVPYTFGNCHIHVDQVTALVEDDRPLPEVALPEIGPVQEAIAEYVAELVPNGATIQIGYGGIPDAVVMQLATKRDLGVHTEMFGDGILSLVEAGVVTNLAKNIDRGIMKATFALGSRKLYDFMDHNPALEMHPVDATNDPYLAGLHDNLHTINGTMQVDLVGQCGSESLGAIPYSGTGGQADFVRAANRSRGGKSFIVLPSTARGGTISRIQPVLTPGTYVSTSKNDVDHVVTEYGVARLRGLSAHERAHALIAIAHPDFRDELTEKAEQLHIL